MLLNPTNASSGSQPEKETDLNNKGTTTDDKAQALPIEEGEIPPTNTPQENVEREECMIPNSSTLPNTNGERAENERMRLISPAGTWETMVK